MIHFTKHAEEKFRILERHGSRITKDQVINALDRPDFIDRISRFPLIIAQAELDREHVLRVVYKQTGKIKTVITFYPGRQKQYGQ